MRIERVLAPNPGPFTGAGTNTWLLDGGGEVLVIDPGPRLRSHESAIVAAVGSRRVGAVLVTHTHEDHAPLANPLALELGVSALGYAPGPQFRPDAVVADGETFTIGDVQLEVVHTPGHSGDHLCFLAGRALFTGDHIIGGSSVMVEDMGAYLASLRRVRALHPDALFPGHGEVMEEPATVIDWYLAHRFERERQVLEAVAAGADSVDAVVATVYRDVDVSLYPLAAVSVGAHLRKLSDDGEVTWEGDRVLRTGERGW